MKKRKDHQLIWQNGRPAKLAHWNPMRPPHDISAQGICDVCHHLGWHMMYIEDVFPEVRNTPWGDRL